MENPALAIRVRYLPLTKHQPSRLVAEAANSVPGKNMHRITIPLDAALRECPWSAEVAAAKQLAQSRNWTGTWVAGMLPDRSWCFCRANIFVGGRPPGASFIIN